MRPERNRGEVLVAIMNRLDDWQRVVNEGWYRIPVDTAPKPWPPKWIAFYKTKVFGAEHHTVTHFARIESISEVSRAELFPDECPSKRAGRRYHRLQLQDLKELPEPIPSLRWRRIVFIPTTMTKLELAQEINDLYNDSPLEDALWVQLRKLEMPAERQFFVRYKAINHCLDFALFCKRGRIDIETDGDVWHSDPLRVGQDNRRNNLLAANGWTVLRFTGTQVREEMAQYCIPQIAETVNFLGGLSGRGR
jgi:very-short-patch-repair endonuclease